MTRSCCDSLNDMLENLLTNFFVEKPCKITKVHSQALVDVEYYDNNIKDTLCKVPVRHMQTKNSFVYMALKPGDCGTVRFLDNSIKEYYQGNSSDTEVKGRKHDVNDNIFVAGFYPEPEQYVFPEGDLVIGTLAGATITLNENSIKISGGAISIEGGHITISGNTMIDGKTFLSHTHSNGNNGSPTGGVL